MFHPSILRYYDIRGVVGETLDADAVFAAGQAFGCLAQQRGYTCLAVCRDGRLSSPAFERALVGGLISQGIHVITLGLGPSSLLYYAVSHCQEIQGGIMITGSHNDKTYNGLKMLFQDGPVWGETLQNFPQLLERAQEYKGPAGMQEQLDLHQAYVNRLLQGMSFSSDMHAVWDCGNGAAGPVVGDLIARLPGTHVLMYEEVDGTFPNHPPDPTIAKNLADLRERVLSQGADLGIAFDGDGDRIGVISGKGHMIYGDQLTALYAQSILETHPGATCIFDIKSSSALLNFLREKGANPLLCPSGHSAIKAMIKETGALIAGELSGHIFFADRYPGYDDGPYAALRLLELLGNTGRDLERLVHDLPHCYQTPEVKIPCATGEKWDLLDALKSSLELGEGEKCIDMDGVRVESAKGWWLLRASNTEECLTLRVEGTRLEHLEALKTRLQNLLAPHVKVSL